MHLYYFNVEPKAVIRYVSEKPLEITDRVVTITLKGREVKIPLEVCFYFDGSMCLYTAPKEIASLMDTVTESLENTVKFFSGFQKFTAPILSHLSADEKKEFKESLYSLNRYQYPDAPAYCNLLMCYFDFLCKDSLLIIGDVFNPETFFFDIRKGGV